MSDPLGLISNITPTQGIAPRPGAAAPASRPSGGPDFKEVLMKQIADVNKLQKDAEMAIEDLAAGRRDDMDGVLIAKQKADIAFKMLLQVRNKMMDAYEEVKQIRV